MSTTDTSSAAPSQPAVRASVRKRWARTGLLVLTSLVAIWSWVLFIRPWQISKAASEAAATFAQTAPPEPSVEEKQRRMVRGTWEDHYQGHRILTIREDGTALMVVELDGLGAILVAPRLEFDIDWTVASGKVTLHTTGGRPEKKARAILNLHTDEACYYLDTLEENRLVLRDVKSNKVFEWKRMSEEAIAKANAPATETE